MVTGASVMPAMIGSYRVVEELGAGGTGRVYLGQHPVIGSKVAIKVLLPSIARNEQTVARFIQEARASSQIGSPHIPRYFDFGTTASGEPYAVMEYFDGETLARRIARVGTLSVAEAARIVSQVASALLMAHDAGLVHRDLKPENIFLVKPDFKAARTLGERDPGVPGVDVKVLDFGIAKVVGNRAASRTQDGYFLGTPFYCAPEQVFGGAVDARTDVYGLGATVFEMLTGAPPFVGEVPHILASKTSEDPPDLRERGVPSLVAHTIHRMLARDPAQRAPSMAWVLEEISRWGQAEGDVVTTSATARVDAVAEDLADGVAGGVARGVAGANEDTVTDVAAHAIADEAYAALHEQIVADARADGAEAVAGHRRGSPGELSVAPPRRRAVPMIAGMFVIAAAAAVVFGVSRLRAAAPVTPTSVASPAAAPTSLPPRSAVDDPAPGAAVRAAVPAIEPTAEPAIEPAVEPIGAAGATPGATPPAAQAVAPAETTGNAIERVPADASPARPGDGSAPRPDDRAQHTSRPGKPVERPARGPGQQHRGAKPESPPDKPADRPADKPAIDGSDRRPRKPDPSDVLIVDPFSNSN